MLCRALGFAASENVPIRTDGAWVSETPAQVADIKLILSGKFLENAKALKGASSAHMGSLNPSDVRNMPSRRL